MKSLAFKEKVTEYLEKENRSEAYLARALRCSPNQFNRWMNGLNRIPYSVVNQICNFFKLEKLQQIELFELADYPLPLWVKDLAKATSCGGRKYN